MSRKRNYDNEIGAYDNNLRHRINFFFGIFYVIS